MRHAPDSLAQFLASMGLTLHALSLQTGIPIARLRSIYRDENATPHELLRLTTALTSTQATTFTQTGRINQAGTANTQHITINIIHIYPSSDSTDAEARTWVTAEEPVAQYQLHKLANHII